LALVRTLERWQHARNEPVIYVTFNYDTILEMAFADVLGLHITAMNDYVYADPRAQLFKLHGSIDWWRRTGFYTSTGEASRAEEEALQRLDQIDLNGEILRSRVSMGPDEKGPTGLRHEMYFPAIAIPISGKPRYETPSLHVDALSEERPRVDRLITIGWKARETRFLDLFGVCWRGRSTPI
jgi:hypothetical protein